MRLDKFLCDANIGTRSQVKTLLKQKTVTVNGTLVTSPEAKVDEKKDIICFRGNRVGYQKYYYYMMNKPQGVVSATQDNIDKTVIDLLKAEDKRNDLFPVGRLDKDTTGFLLISNDGDLSHRLLSPKKHVDKTYEVGIEHALSSEEIKALEEGVDIGEKNRTLPAKVEVLEENTILLTIREGKFHQVKRMLLAVNNQVITLKRITFGGLALDTALAPGEYRELTESEINTLHEA